MRRHFGFDEDLYNNCPKWVNIDGYLQTEKYFKEIEDVIREDFTFKPQFLRPCRSMIGSFEDPVSLHIRRTDYLDLCHTIIIILDWITMRRHCLTLMKIERCYL